MMLLIYFDTDTEKSFMYASSMDKYRDLGEPNRLNEILTGLYIYDYKADNIIGFYSSSVFMWGLQFR